MRPPHERFAVEPDRIRACLGLISDTHMPDRLSGLPPALFEILRGVDLLLHAGDVGELYVLDQLSAIAPVVAVHGNDDTPAARQHLPAQQVIAIAGRRLVLFHSHYPDREQELASRQVDEWQPRLDYRAAVTRQAGGQIGIFGHSHIPMSVHHDGVLLVNPGAIASGGYTTRQQRQTVALLAILDSGEAQVAHSDLANPERHCDFQHDLAIGFTALARRFNTPIVEPLLDERFPRLWPLMEQAREACVGAWRQIAFRCWDGSPEVITAAEYLAELRSRPGVPPALLAQIEAVLA